MTADQLLIELFVNHWLATTLFMPQLALVYAWVTDQTGWWISSLMLFLAYGFISRYLRAD